jgi:hypothetical protein
MRWKGTVKNTISTIDGSSSDKVRVKKAAWYFGLSESFLRHALMKNIISGYRLGGAVFVSLSEIEEIISNNKI